MPKSAPPAAGEHRDAAVDDGSQGDRNKAPTSSVDAGEPASVSFAATSGDGSGSTAASSRSKGDQERAVVGVGPGIPGAMLLGSRAGLLGMNPFPIVGARIHPPLLRADTLSRERLNDWLDQAATGRVALVVAEAGFGKTTFLGDWARNSPRLTAWYRLDPDDRDWLTFSRHLVAAGRELDAEFAPDTYALLMQLGPGGPTRADIEATLVREYSEFGAAHPRGLTLIFDDYHSVDGSDEVVPLVRALIEQTGPGFSIVIASRAAPHLPFGRLRARGAVSRIGAEALCFDVPEADRLFRDAYRLPIEPDVVNELIQRTEGWAALLSLVSVGLGEQSRPDPRAFVAQLSATRGHLYDFLAEEVVATLDPELHDFLTRVSVLTSVDQRSAQLVWDGGATEISLAIQSAEELGLLTQPDRESPHRFHPLVRAFLLSQFTGQVGQEEVISIHRRIGRALEESDWASAAWHYRAAGDTDSAERVVDSAIESIFAEGLFERVRPFLDGSAGSRDRPVALILRSRLELLRGNYSQATALARRAVQRSQGSDQSGQALLNLSSIFGFGGFEDQSATLAEEALTAGLSEAQHSIARATIAMWEAGREGALDLIAEQLASLAEQQDLAEQRRYAGITRLNLSNVLLWLGDAAQAAQVASRAQRDLGGRAVGSAEFVAAVAAEASAHAQLGDAERARRLLASALDVPSRLGRDEVYLEGAKLEAEFGDASLARAALDQVDPRGSAGLTTLANLCGGTLAIRVGDFGQAAAYAHSLDSDQCRDVAGLLRGQLLRTRVALQTGAPDRQDHLERLRQLASAQRSRPGLRAHELLRVLTGPDVIHREVIQLEVDETYLLSQLAEEIVGSLSRLSPDALTVVRAEAQRRSARWAPALRLAIERGQESSRNAIELLAGIGGPDDSAVIRSMALRDKALRPVASSMTRRLAPRVEIADLGTVDLYFDDRPVGRRLRRKVLGLLCFVSSRPEMAATRDEALDALWPDLAPSTAVNSLHQTTYFLRRLLEPDYREGIGAGYVQFDGEVLSFDSELMDSRSRRCWRLISAWQGGDATAVDTLLATYTGKFALDFSYEDWAEAYREMLHAAVLGAVEQWIDRLLGAGKPDQAARAAQRILLMDPTADEIELLLLRAYKRGGRHAAAAEQYAHYASMIREDLGAEPTPFSEI